jgi:hypothetical protein
LGLARRGIFLARGLDRIWSDLPDEVGQELGFFES